MKIADVELLLVKNKLFYVCSCCYRIMEIDKRLFPSLCSINIDVDNVHDMLTEKSSFKIWTSV